MRNPTLGGLLAGSLAVLLGGGCHHSTPSSPTSAGGTSTGTPNSSFPAGTLVLKASPIDQNAIRWITPLGNLNPPAHTVPTDHIYFYFSDPDKGESFSGLRTPFYAPGDGTVTTVLGGAGTESKIYVRQTSTMTYYLDHLILASGIAQGTRLTAGDVVGTTGLAYAIDLGVMNDSLTLSFANPSRYPPDTTHADAPLKYFEEPIRSQLYARVQRLGPDLDGKIDYDIAGHLAGNWFVNDSLPVAFVYDTYSPSTVLIASSFGPISGTFAIGPGEPLPRDVTSASGKVLYSLAKTYSGPLKPGLPQPAGFMLVQMFDNGTIKLEIFAGTTPPGDFTGNARTLVR